MKSLLLTLCFLLISAPALAEIKVDAPAPVFTETDASGKSHSLKDFAGKWVVLEWFNKDCPYVKKHYGAKNMQELQKAYTSKGVVWLTVNSSAPGKQGHQSPDETLAEMKANGSAATAVLLDTDGNMGKAYGAKTTPHMYVINPQGQVVYMGAIDDNDSANPSVIPKSKNHVREALDLAMAGKPVAVKTTKPYGCSVKY